MRSRPTLMLLLVASLLIAACSRGTPAPVQPAAASQPTAAPTPAPAPQAVADDEKPLAQPYKIVVAGTNNLFGTVYEVAMEKGFFLKHGIQASIKIFSTGQEAAKALTTGDAQLGTSAMNNFQTELGGGVKHVAVFAHMGNAASLINDQPLAITARPDVGIRAGHPEDLKGKTVGLSLGGTAELYLRAVLRQAGVDAASVKMVNVPPANSLTVLQNKSVDAISSWEPYQTVIMGKLPGAVMVQQAGGYLGYVIFDLVEAKTITEQPDLVLRMVAAYAEAAQWTRQNATGAGEVATHWIQGLDAADGASGLKNVIFDPRISDITRQAWDLSNNLLKQDGKLKDPVPAMQGNFDTSFLEKVLKDHPGYFSDLPPAQNSSFK